MRTVAVMGDKSKTVCTCVLSFASSSRKELTKDHHQNAVASGFFIAPITVTAPLALLSTPDCGGEGEKRFSLTQGERLHEGCAPSDKQGLGLIDRHCTGQTPALINKAAQHNKGSNPIVDTQQGEDRDSLNLRLNHHPYRSPCIA